MNRQERRVRSKKRCKIRKISGTGIITIGNDFRARTDARKTRDKRKRTRSKRFEILKINKDKNIKFCKHNCKSMNPKEVNQTSKKEPHLCGKFKKPLAHYGFHPKLIKLEECKQ